VKIRNALTLSALAGLMALSFAAGAQQWGHQSDQKSGQWQNSSHSSDKNKDPGSQSQRGSGSQGQRGTGTGSSDNGRTSNRGSQGNSGSGQKWSGGGSSDNGRDSNRGGQDNGHSSNGWTGSGRGGQQPANKNDHRPIEPTRHRDDNRDSDWQRSNGRQSDGNWSRGNGSNYRNDDWNRGNNWNQGYRHDSSDDWGNLIRTLGFIADITLLEHDRTLYFDGDEGSYYPVWQYDRDCDSYDRRARERAEFFHRDFFYRNDARFERRVVTHNGERCYQFYRVG
jgi:hypothetical protein